MENTPAYRIYQDSKELPLFNYRRIIQTGDFYYMVKSYEPGDHIAEEISFFEEKFNELNQEFAFSSNQNSQEFSDYSDYINATFEYNKLTAIYQIIEILSKAKEQLILLGADTQEKEINKIVQDALEGVKIERNPDLKILSEKLKDKICYFESKIERYKHLLGANDDENNNDEFDLDEQLVTVCLGLEIPIPDETKLTLYQYNLLVKKLIEKVKALDKINAKYE